jgi:hypothetical protein
MLELHDDITIIGSGPTGLTLALILKYYGHRVTVLEREGTPGGCHRVTRVNDGRGLGNGLFTEHGPRIYTSGSKTFHNMLLKAGIDHEKYFTAYKAQISEPLIQSLKYFTSTDILTMISSYMKYIIDTSYGSDMTVSSLKLSTQASEYTDKMCRLTDGAGADRYTLNSFMRLIDHKFTETIQQPKKANDKEGGWVADLVKQLQINGVQFLFNKEVQGIELKSNELKSNELKSNELKSNELKSNELKHVKNLEITTQDGEVINTNVIIFATPTDALERILSNSKTLSNTFGSLKDLKEFNKHSLYETYLPVTLHWRLSPVKIPNIWGNGIGEWNIAWINMTDYISNEPGTIISACITKTDAVNIYGKTANECTADELRTEVLRQLEPLINTVRKPDSVLLSPEIYRSGDKWVTRDNAYMRTAMNTVGRPSYATNHKIFSVGCHNENNNYKFTSVESAVQNAYYWAHNNIPGSETVFPIITGLTLSLLIKYALILLVVACIVYYLFITRLLNYLVK